MPGSVHSPLTKGCHSLSKRAKLAETAEDILEELKLPARGAAALAVADEPTHAILRISVTIHATSHSLARKRVAADFLAALLTQWEIEGLIEALPGGRYQRLR